METRIVSVDKIVRGDALSYNGVSLLTYRIAYPQFWAPAYRACLASLNRCYMAKALGFQKYCETELFSAAVEQYRMDLIHNDPVRVFEAVLTYEIAYDVNCVMSLYFDRYVYTGGAHGSTVRDAQTWDLLKCRAVRLRRLIRCCPGPKAFAVRAVRSQIRKEPEIYFADENLASETFRSENFYCTPEGVVIYYQQYDIAPYASEIRTFLLPYGGCVLDPRILCGEHKCPLVHTAVCRKVP